MDLAADNWRKVLLVNPNQTEALAGLARRAKEDGQTAKESEYLGRLRKIDPRDPEIQAVENLRVLTPEQRNRLNEAGRLAMQHKPDEAMKIYRQVLGDQPPPLGKWAQPFYETEALSTGGKEKAISQLRQLCAQHPKQEAYRLWLASLLSYDPKTRMEAFQLFQSIKDPGFAEQARAPWRKALLWEEKNPQALPSIQAYLQRYPDTELQAAAAGLQAKQQQMAADQDREQGFKALQSQHLETAAAEFNAVLRHSPDDANALVGLGYVRLNQKRFDEAFNLFGRALKVAPQRQDARNGYDSARFWLAMQQGANAQQQNQSAAAAMAFQEALTLRPFDNGALLGLANALVQERQFAQAETKFQQVLTHDPNNADALSGLAFIRLNEGKFDQAQKLFAEAHKLDPARKDVSQGYRNAKFWGIMHQAAAALDQNQAKAAVAEYQQALQISPEDKDALQGLANACMRADDYPGAAKAYYRLVAAYPAQESNWLGLIRAQMKEEAPQAALSTAQRIPPAVRQKLENSSDFLSEMALVDYGANQAAAGDQALRRAMQLARTSDSSDALSLRLQIAGEFLDHGQTARAIEIFIQATQLHPDDPSGWEGLVGAYTRGNDFSDAVSAVRRMPQKAYNAAEKHPGFLNSVALLYSARGQCSEAQNFLQRSLNLDQAAGQQPDESTQLQLADVWMREHSYTQAQSLYHDIITRNGNSVQAWRGYLVALHQKHDDGKLAAEIPHIPAAVRTRLEIDPSFLILEASAYSSTDQNRDALPLLEQARSRYKAQSKLPPVNLDIQTAWTMLAVSANEPGLGDLLADTKSRGGLTPQQRAAIEELWSTWSIRRADLAFKTKPQLAFSILEDAGRVYPGNRNLEVALASLYLKRHDKQKALDVFQAWGMAGAQAEDYRMAAGAALSAHKNGLADQYLRRGLARFPNDPELLHMSAQREIARGDYNAGERELQSALFALRSQGTAAPAIRTQAQLLPRTQEDSPVSSVTHEDAGGPSNSDESAPPCRAESAGDARIRPISLTFIVPQAQAGDAPSAGARPPASQAQVQSQKEEEQMEQESEAVEDRNTPVISFGDTGSGRVGDAGIDRLVINDSVVSATYTASNSVRFAVEGHGVIAYSGTPDGSASLPYGTLPAYALFDQQDQTGYGGLGELSTKTFGLAVGTSPQNFPVHNIIGGIRFRPFDGPFLLMGVRDSVKDSLLSYAGARDPKTGLRWGGVVANTGTASFNSAPRNNAVYRTIGVNVSGSFSFLQGLNVPDNWSMFGNAGLYWQVVQGLTIGVNGGAMHYDKNLKYFSFGQGGYFSPQQYYLGSIPISWYSRHPRFEYEVRFSGGIQYLQESRTQFYPVLPGSTKVTQGYYASDTSVAPNYDLNLRLGYRVAPHVYFGTFATANNAENYYQQSAGFSLKFMIDRIPTHTDLRVNSIPDWKGQQPFDIQ
ncbi:MAG TPA: cellulose synthase subunit BcsC-related outer membrane protein [Terracidiphilus sp.]|nr:cellulose synthase subunit BcsC-related outer membrane protein [Terracidiphilus sp.]